MKKLIMAAGFLTLLSGCAGGGFGADSNDVAGLQPTPSFAVAPKHPEYQAQEVGLSCVNDLTQAALGSDHNGDKVQLWKTVGSTTCVKAKQAVLNILTPGVQLTPSVKPNFVRVTCGYDGTRFNYC